MYHERNFFTTCNYWFDEDPRNGCVQRNVRCGRKPSASVRAGQTHAGEMAQCNWQASKENKLSDKGVQKQGRKTINFYCFRAPRWCCNKSKKKEKSAGGVNSQRSKALREHLPQTRVRPTSEVVYSACSIQSTAKTKRKTIPAASGVVTWEKPSKKQRETM